MDYLQPPPAEIAEKLDQLNNWRNQRQEKYGNIGEQLNLLFDDIDAGLFGEQAKNGQWYNHIKNIKDGIIKPDVDSLTTEIDTLIANQNRE